MNIVPIYGASENGRHWIFLCSEVIANFKLIQLQLYEFLFKNGIVRRLEPSEHVNMLALFT